VETALGACQSQHVHDPATVARSVFVDTSGIACTDFGITDEQREQLMAAGEQAVVRFLADWDHDTWRSTWGAA